ncbi:MAG: cytochrome C [Desulfovibrionales bacterium]|nr:cytochrome C [Desulfovibrionales bacterium]
MMKGRSLLRLAGMLLVVALVSIAGIKAHSSSIAASTEQRADVVTIDVIGKLGDMELPAVTYRHDLHTEALQKQNKDCATCHEVQDGTMSLFFKRTQNMSAEELQETYHKNCIGCHTDMAAAEKDTGPLESECRTCHDPRPDASAVQERVGMDASLHFRHISSSNIAVTGQDKNCGACHQNVDRVAATATWIPDTEDSDNAYGAAALAASSDKEAAHMACITCHMQDVTNTAPTTCAGCHSADTQKENKKVTYTRLDRGQPDALLIVPATEKSDIAPVAFDHKLHEAVAPACSTCHINGIGNAQDGFKPLYNDAHDAQSSASCVGCHAMTVAEDPTCAGCHSMIPVKEFNDNSCATCHNAGGVTTGQAMGMDKKERNTLAAATIARREANAVTYTADEIPEFVTIDVLSKEYEPSKMPHRKIVNTMLNATEGNKLAASFHAEKGKVCAACHHQAPVSMKPPKCQSCHGDAFSQDDRPGLKAAYHQQCMTCHTAMDIQKPQNTDCAGCHAPRAN